MTPHIPENRIYAIDPGPLESGVVIMRDGQVIYSAQLANKDVLPGVRNEQGIVAIEMVACYGMAVGKEVFETCLWIGRFIQASIHPEAVRLVYRKDVKIHLCNSMKAKDPNIRKALIDKHGPCGTKKAPGKLYGISGHLWSALAVADYVNDHTIY